MMLKPWFQKALYEQSFFCGDFMACQIQKGLQIDQKNGTYQGQVKDTPEINDMNLMTKESDDEQEL